MEARDANPEDMESWLRIRRTIWPHASPGAHMEDIEAGLARKDGRRFVLIEEEGGAEVAFVECRMITRNEGPAGEGGDASEGCIEAWYIVPKYRAGGIGRALLNYLQEWFQPRGCSRLTAPKDLSADVFCRANTDQPIFDRPLFFVPTGR